MGLWNQSIRVALIVVSPPSVTLAGATSTVSVCGPVVVGSLITNGTFAYGPQFPAESRAWRKSECVPGARPCVKKS